MPHLDFREALSTPEQQVFPTANVATAVVAPLPARSLTDLLRRLQLSRSAWANIVFVAIASVGGLVCAFYFFNGGELLQAAASWPKEYLYPRPVPAEQHALAQELSGFDRFANENESNSRSSSTDAKNSGVSNALPSNILQPPTLAGGPTTSPGGGVAEPPSPPITIFPPPLPPPPTSLFNQISNDLNTVAPGSAATVQSLYHTVASTGPGTTALQTTKDVAKPSKRKLATAKQKAVSTVRDAASTAKSLQPNTANQSMNATRRMNQMMSSGGLGGMGSAGLIGSVSGGGSSASSGTGATSGVGSAAGGVGSVGSVGGVGGLGGAGLGGGVAGGVGGTVGGIVGGHH